MAWRHVGIHALTFGVFGVFKMAFGQILNIFGATHFLGGAAFAQFVLPHTVTLRRIFENIWTFDLSAGELGLTFVSKWILLIH